MALLRVQTSSFIQPALTFVRLSQNTTTAAARATVHSSANFRLVSAAPHSPLPVGPPAASPPTPATRCVRCYSNPSAIALRPYHVAEARQRPVLSLVTQRDSSSARTPVSVRSSGADDRGSRDHTHLESQVSAGIYLLPLLVVGVAVGAYKLTTSKEPLSSSPRASELLDLLADDMNALPGRPGNLTPEQDEALRRFWSLFLQTCGVFTEDGEHETELKSASTSGLDTEAAGEKKKKRGLSLFKKKKDKDDDKSAKATDDAIKTNDADDKWGETKAYHETLAKHTPEEIRATIWGMVKHDHPDALLLRFLRARKWDEHKALVMLMSCMNWRADEAHVDDDIMFNGEKQPVEHEAGDNPELKQAAADFLSQMRLAKSYIHGVDKSGRPISVTHARLHKADEQSQESLERYTVYLIETSRLMLTPPADTGCVMFDMTGFSLANMDYTPVKFIIKCFEANYPESLGVVLIHKSPWLFQGIWKIIRGWLDPVVASKVNFTNSIKDLEEFIDKDRIPKDLDGPEDWTFKYVEPVPGENDRMKDTATRDKLLQEREGLYQDFESQTVAWIRETDAEKRKAMLTERNGVAKKLRQQYWQLDPYIRARSIYDRIGVIKGDGTVDHYANSSSTKPVPVGKATATQVATSADDVD